MLGLGMFVIDNVTKDHGWEYISRPYDNTIWISGKFEPNTDFLIYHRNKKSKLVIDMSIEHWGGSQSQCIDMTYKLLCEYLDNFILLTHNPYCHQKLPNLLFFPYWYYRSKQFFHTADTDCFPKKYKISCLNGHPRFHRIANFYRLVCKSYSEEIYKKIHLTESLSARPDDFLLPETIVDWWEKYSLSITNYRSEIKNIWHHDADETWPAYKNSYLNLVTEMSVLPDIFITEKTWKAVASGQLFLVFGNQCSLDHLKSLGIDIFDDIVDHTYYDQEPNWLMRLEKIHEILDGLVSQDLEKIWKQTYSRRLANQQKFYAGDFDPGYKNQLINRLS